MIRNSIFHQKLNIYNKFVYFKDVYVKLCIKIRLYLIVENLIIQKT